MGMFTPSKNYVGIDIGSTSIKIVELEQAGSGARLVNYGFSETTKFIPSNWHENEKLTANIINEIYKKDINIFKEAQINLMSLETETFSLIRSLIGNDKSTIMMVEIGANTTDVSIVDNGIPMLNRSIDIGGMTITKAIAKNLNISLEKAEQFKYDLGISSMNSDIDVVPKTIIDTIEPIINEIKYAVNLFQTKDKKNTEKIILSGGSVMLPNLANYLSKILDINVIVGDPWSRISYPEDLKPLLHEIGPRLSVAIGLAMSEI